MPALRSIAWLAAVLAAVATAAPVVPPAPAQRPDLPLRLRDAGHARAGAARLAAVPFAPQASAQRFDPQVTGFGAIADRFGSSFALDGDTLLVGAVLDTINVPNSRNGASSGTATVYRRVAGAWQFESVLVPKPAVGNEQAGVAVALRGGVAVMGARFGTGEGEIAEAGDAHVFERSGTTWNSTAILVATPSQPDAQFGDAVATDGNAVVVGAPRYDTAAGVDAGAVFVFRRNGADWPLVRVVTAPDAAPGDNFGASVALEGDVLFVGAPLRDQPGVAANRGAVYTFTRGLDDWPFAAVTTAAGAAADARFGSALALDASRLLVGATRDAPAGVAHGSATLFARAGATLSAPRVLVPPGGAAGDSFGAAVALGTATVLVGAPDHNVSEGAGYVYVDGPGGYAFQARLEQPDGPFSESAGFAVALVDDEALLGAPSEDIPPNRAQGAVHRYARAGTQWSQLLPLQTGDGAAFEAFGSSVSVTDRRIAVGSFLDDSIVAADDAGSVSVFVRNGVGWTREARIEAFDAVSQDRFGVSVVLRDEELLVGAYFSAVNDAINRGAVYSLGNDGNGAWTNRQKLIAFDGLVNDFFGFALARDGNRVLVGAPGVDASGEDAGAAYVFDRGISWVQSAKLLPPPGAGFAGFSVALQGDIALVGAPDFTPGDLEFQGGVHVYVRNGTGAWQYARTILAPDAGEGDAFGFAVALDHGIAAITALNADRDGAEDNGAVYLYAIGAASETLLEQRASPTPIDGSAYGIALALDERRLVVGETGVSGPGGELGQGRVWTLSRAGSSFGPQVPVEAPTARPLQFFGRSVATSFATLGAAAPEYQRDNPREGAAYAIDDPDRLFRDGFE
ncbi:MAG TPA: hypothetical protein VFL14_02085 [Xanthomonadales bacterium]|nr:hypothetical protein [Xanthomonadales bacterium]